MEKIEDGYIDTATQRWLVIDLLINLQNIETEFHMWLDFLKGDWNFFNGIRIEVF